MTNITVDLNNLKFAGWQSPMGTASDRDLCLGLVLEMFGIPLFEFFDTACSVNKLLFPGEKRVTGRADLHPDFRLDRTQLNFIATGAYSLYLVIFGM